MTGVSPPPGGAATSAQASKRSGERLRKPGDAGTAGRRLASPAASARGEAGASAAQGACERGSTYDRHERSPGCSAAPPQPAGGQDMLAFLDGAEVVAVADRASGETARAAALRGTPREAYARRASRPVRSSSLGSGLLDHRRGEAFNVPREQAPRGGPNSHNRPGEAVRAKGVGGLRAIAPADGSLGRPSRRSMTSGSGVRGRDPVPSCPASCRGARPRVALAWRSVRAIDDAAKRLASRKSVGGEADGADLILHEEHVEPAGVGARGVDVGGELAPGRQPHVGVVDQPSQLLVAR
jgi:hypothetical protein